MNEVVLRCLYAGTLSALLGCLLAKRKVTTNYGMTHDATLKLKF